MGGRVSPSNAAGGAEAPPDLWDPIIRLSHWGIAVVVLVNAAVLTDGDAVHIWLGWIGMALLAVRLVWGLVGPAEARFSAFPPNPRAALAHLADLATGRARAHASHNPAGALMVYAIWAMLAVVIATGLVMTDGASPMRISEQNAAIAAGDWSVLVSEADDDGGHEDDEDDEAGEWVKEVHEVAANLLLFLAALHVLGVAVESRAMRRNLVSPMIAGNRQRPGS